MPANIAGVRLVLEEGGIDLADKVNPRLLSLTLTEKRGEEADELRLTLHNHDGLLAAPAPGKVIALSLGWATHESAPAGLVSKGRFVVDEVEESGPPDIVAITARSADLTGTLRQRQTEAHHATTLGALLQKIARRHGLAAQVHPTLAGKSIDAIEQHGKSDAAFVADLGRRFDALATWKDRKLLFMPHGATTTAAGTPIPARVLTRVDGWAWRCTRAERAEATGAQAEWYDADAGHRRRVNAGNGHHYRLKHVYSSEAEATQAATAAAGKGERGAWSFDYDLAIADCTLQPGARVTLSGWSPPITARTWLVASVETALSDQGLRQKLTMESA